jgi:uncharacterized protein (DUF2267 family)
MSDRKLNIIDTTVEKTYEWLRDVREELHTDDNQVAYQILRAVLHALRDRLTVEEAAQFPLLVRGIYYEGWRPAGKPLTLRSREEFFNYLHELLPEIPLVFDPERFTRAVFAVLRRYVTVGELQDVIQMLPKDLQTLWPES